MVQLKLDDYILICISNIRYNFRSRDRKLDSRET